MKTPTQDQRIDLWRSSYARSALIESRNAALLILSLQDDITADHNAALLTAMVVAYARPFTNAQVTRCRRIMPLSEDFIPSAFLALHRELMTLRHKVFGHSDATAANDEGFSLNAVIVTHRQEAIDVYTVRPGACSPSKLLQVVRLCEYIITKCEDRQAEFIEAFPLNVPHGVGEFVLNLEDMERPWAIRSDG